MREQRRRVVTSTSGPLRIVGDAYGDPAAPPVVLLHGGGQTRHAWGGTAAALARARAPRDRARPARPRRQRLGARRRLRGRRVRARPVRRRAPASRRKPAVVGRLARRPRRADRAGRARRPAGVGRRAGRHRAARRSRPASSASSSFMTAHPDGFATLEEAADAVAAYVPHRPRPRDLNGLRKNLRLGADGRYRWHWDPRFMSGKRPPDAPPQNPERLEAAARALRVPTLLVRGRQSDVVQRGRRARLPRPRAARALRRRLRRRPHGGRRPERPLHRRPWSSSSPRSMAGG